MNLHQERHFEAEICQHLAANGWLHAEGDAAGYPDRRLRSNRIGKNSGLSTTVDHPLVRSWVEPG
jgi:hypothetical protein